MRNFRSERSFFSNVCAVFCFLQNEMISNLCPCQSWRLYESILSIFTYVPHTISSTTSPILVGHKRSLEPVGRPSVRLWHWLQCPWQCTVGWRLHLRGRYPMMICSLCWNPDTNLEIQINNISPYLCVVFQNSLFSWILNQAHGRLLCDCV